MYIYIHIFISIYIYITNKKFKINQGNFILSDMGKLYDVDFINNHCLLKPCDRPEFVYTTISRCYPVFLAVPTQNNAFLTAIVL